MPHSVAATTAPRPGDELTVIENLAISLVYKALGECRYYRTATEYAAIESRVPHMKQLKHVVNEALRNFLEPYGDAPPEFIRFKAGHTRYRYESYPCKISSETIRTALIKHGFRQPRQRKINH